MTGGQTLSLVAIATLAMEILGLLLAGRAILRTRTPQGAIAWSMALVSMPLVAVPLYLVFGRSKFVGYVDARRAARLQVRQAGEQAWPHVLPFHVDLGGQGPEGRVLAKLARLPMSNRNDAQLLIDGRAAFDAIFAAIGEAQRYVLVQFYIVRDDGLGRELLQRLVARAQAGVRTYFLYDEIGANGLSRAYLEELRQAGVEVSGIRTTRGWRNRFQLNFRNHRKVVVVDGRTAFVGGLNV